MNTEPAAPKPRPPGRWLLVQAVTLARLPLSALFALVLLLWGPREPLAALAALLLLSGNELSDLFDGMLARRYGIVSEIGAMLDPYADSISRLGVYWTLALAGLVNPGVPLAMAIRDVTVAYARIVLTRTGRSVAARKSGKIKAWVQAIGAYAALLGPWYWPWTGEWPRPTISWIVILATLASMVEYLLDARRAWQASGECLTERRS